jgi:hypothetical protein
MYAIHLFSLSPSRPHNFWRLLSLHAAKLPIAGTLPPIAEVNRVVIYAGGRVCRARKEESDPTAL